MKRIGITQRVDLVVSYGERRDCLDQNWTRLLERIGLVGIPLSNVSEHPWDYLESLSLDGIILSGGNNLGFLGDVPGVAHERDRFETIVLEWALFRNVPLLGICRGFQMMNHFLGGRLKPINRHVAVRHSVHPDRKEQPFGDYREVNSYHDYGITIAELGTGLIPLVTAEDGIIEAARHEELPWVAIMWHPEREQPFQSLDMEMITMVFEKEYAKREMEVQ